MRGVRSTSIVVAAALLLGGCATNQDTGLAVGAVAGGLIGNQFGNGTGRVLATAAGAVVGGIVGSEIGRRMDEHDRRMAEEAEFDALERGESDRPRKWRNPDNGHYGEITPRKPYKRGVADCRDYAHTVFIDGKRETVTGTACRNGDGTWKSVA